MWRMPVVNRGPQNLRDTPPAHHCSQCPSHSAMFVLLEIKFSESHCEKALSGVTFSVNLKGSLVAELVEQVPHSSRANVAVIHWWQIHISSGNGLVSRVNIINNSQRIVLKLSDTSSTLQWRISEHHDVSNHCFLNTSGGIPSQMASNTESISFSLSASVMATDIPKRSFK